MNSTTNDRARELAAAEDRRLMRRIASGDEQAFEQLYRLHRRRTLSQARRLCSSLELAEDLTQECFASAWRSAHLYRAERGPAAAWLTGILRNRAIDAWRRAASRPLEVADDLGGRRQAEIEHEPAGADQAEIRAHLAALPDEQREVLFLAFYAGFTYAQIAASSYTSLGTVKGRGRLGLRKLRASLGEQPSDVLPAGSCAA